MIKLIICKATIGSIFEKHEYTSDNGLISFKLGSEKAQIVNGGYAEAVKLTADLVADDFIFSLLDTELVDLTDVSYFDVLVEKEGVMLYRGVLSLENMGRDYSDNIITITAYGYEYIMKKIEDAESPTPLFSLGTYLTRFNQYLSQKVHRGSMLLFPSLISANNSYQENILLVPHLMSDADIVDQGMINWTNDVVENFITIDTWSHQEYRYIAWKVLPEWTGSQVKYRMWCRIYIANIYNNVCLEEVDDSYESIGPLYSSVQDALDDMTALKDLMPTYYQNSSWIGTAFNNYFITNGQLRFSGFILPTQPIFKDFTPFAKMLKAYFLMHRLTFRFSGFSFNTNGTLTDPIMEIVKSSVGQNTGNDVTSRVLSMVSTRMTAIDFDLDALDALRGDNKHIKSYILNKYNSLIFGNKQFKITVDDLSSDDIKLLDVITAKEENVRVLELEKDLIADEYNIIAWRVND